MKYFIRKAKIEDISKIVAIYNSNSQFLQHHAGYEHVSTEWIAEELQSMKASGFSSCVIFEKSSQKVIGILEYQMAETAYLSLLMLDYEQQEKGIGQEIYKLFEEIAKQNHCCKIRIDVVNDYSPNVVGFWEKQGFEAVETILLTWGEKTSSALIMTKDLG